MDLKQARNVLGLDPEVASVDERTVRRAYAKLAKTWRPDSHPEKFAEIRKAYDAVMESLSAGDDTVAVPVSIKETRTVQPVASKALEREPHLVKAVCNTDETTDHKAENEGNGKVVSYVMMAAELGSVEEDVPAANPLWELENQFVQAVKAMDPANLEDEAHLVQLMEDYLSAASRHSRSLRDYVERFLIGSCLGDYYLPHAVRKRAADFSGLGNAVVVEHRLKPWEREFLLRFDESEIVDELFTKANVRERTAEKSLVHNAGYGQMFLHRLERKDVRSINRWIQWLDETFGSEAGFIHPQFRKRWHRLRQVEPLSTFTLVLFSVLMAASGVVLNALGVPLDVITQQPAQSIVITLTGLAVLSWVNFVLVVLARPVYREVQHRVMVFTLAHLAKPLLVLELTAMVALIWGSVFAPPTTSVWGSPVVATSGAVFLLLAFASRAGGWLDSLPFTQLALRVGVYYLLLLLVGALLGDVRFLNSVQLLLGLSVIGLRTRPMMHWRMDNALIKPRGVFALRLQNRTYRTLYIRLLMAGAGLACIGILAGQKFIFESPLNVTTSHTITAILLSVLALELALNGGIFFHKGPKSPSYRRIFRAGVFIVIGLIVIRLPGILDVVVSLQLTLACFLIFAAMRHFSHGLQKGE